MSAGATIELVVTILTGISLLSGGWLVYRRLEDKADRWFDDWNGTPARPGVPARLGVMARLAVLEENSSQTRADLAVVVHEVSPNSGLSIKDAVDRTEVKVDAQSARLDRHLELDARDKADLWQAITACTSANRIPPQAAPPAAETPEETT